MVFSALLMIKHCTVDKCILQSGADVDKNKSTRAFWWSALNFINVFQKCQYGFGLFSSRLEITTCKHTDPRRLS